MGSRIKNCGRFAAVAAVGGTLVLGMAPAASAAALSDAAANERHYDRTYVQVATKVTDGDSEDEEFEYKIEDREFEQEDGEKKKFRIDDGDRYRIKLLEAAEDCELDEIKVEGADWYKVNLKNDSVRVEVDKGDTAKVTFKYECEDGDWDGEDDEDGEDDGWGDRA